MFLSVVFSFLFHLVTALVPAAAHAAASGDFAGLIDIGGGRKMYLECRGTGSPTVVLVGGLRASAEDWGIADKSAPAALHEVSKFTRVCACDRPGTPVGEKPSRSDSVPQPVTAGDAVADLHALLTAAGEAKPYVLVGHSYGGLIVRLYASTYPEDVSGLGFSLTCQPVCSWQKPVDCPGECGRESACNLLMWFNAPASQSGEICKRFNADHWTLNQRVQGSSPCAPTNIINHLADFRGAIPTNRQRLIPTNRLLLFDGTPPQTHRRRALELLADRNKQRLFADAERLVQDIVQLAAAGLRQLVIDHHARQEAVLGAGFRRHTAR